MAINVMWDNDQQTIARMIYDEGWNWDEHRAGVQQTGDLMATVDHPVHVIVDLSATKTAPSGAIGRLGETFRFTPENWSKTLVLVTSRLMARMIMGAVTRVYSSFVRNHRFLFADTLAEARALLAELDH